jgi:vanillate O-demethylase ferredoxin subunit
MTFRNQLDPVIYPQLSHSRTCASPLPLDVFAQHAKADNLGSKIDYLRIQNDPAVPIAVRFLNKDTLYYDRCTGALLGSQNRYSGIFGVLEYIHRGRWGAFGGIIMGMGALAMLVLLAGVGVYLWWPRKPRRLIQGFQLNHKLKGQAFNLGLHRTVGAWVALPLVIIALTGLPNAFDGLQSAIRSIGSLPETRHVSQPPQGEHPKKIALQALWQTINTISQSPSEVLIHVARKPTDPVEIFYIARGAPHTNARSYLFLDAYSGKILGTTPYDQSGLGDKIYYWMLSVHTGDVGGLPWQIIRFAAMMGALILGYTGISTYLRRRFARKRKAAISGKELTARVSQDDRITG